MAVDAHAAFTQADVGKVLFTRQHPASVLEIEGLAPGIVPDKVDIRPLADFGLHMAEAQCQGVDPHFAFKRQLSASPRYKGQVKAWPVVLLEGVEDVIAVVDVAPVVERTCECPVEQQHLVFVQVDVQKLRLDTRRVFAVLHPSGPCRFHPLFPSPFLGSDRSGRLGHKKWQGHAMLGGVELVPHPGKRPPPLALWPTFWVVVDGHLLQFIKAVGKGRDAAGIVRGLGIRHALHQWFGWIFGFLVRTNHRGFEVHTSRFQGDVDDLGDTSLNGNALSLVPQA